MDILEAAQLIQDHYPPDTAPPPPRLPSHPDWADLVQFHLLGTTLVLPGTNQFEDKVTFWGGNRPQGSGKTFDILDGGTGAGWHWGFLEYTELLFHRIDDWDPIDLIAGHSLGAGAAQLLSRKTGRPAICFASPGIGRDRDLGDQPQVLNITRSDDPIRLAAFGVARAGHSHILRTGHLFPSAERAHPLRAYMSELGDPAKHGDVPRVWPPLIV